ncbi:hypothetical protein H310_15412, partial [Aphanomyces invadans]
ERASGVSEDESEKTRLLDDLVAAYDDAKEEEAQKAALQKKSLEDSEQVGHIIREEAMLSLGKRKKARDDEGSGRGGNSKVVRMMAMMHEQVKADMEFQRIKHANEMEERQKDRELFAQQIRHQQESMTALINLLVNKS